MAVLNLSSLVLRGVVVLRDEVAGGVRLGTSVKAMLPTPAPLNLTRHANPGCQPIANPSGWPFADYDRDAGAMPGAGRSHSRGSVPTSTRSTLPAGGSTDGGSRSTTVVNRSGTLAALAATVGAEISASRHQPLAQKPSAGRHESERG